VVTDFNTIALGIRYPGRRDDGAGPGYSENVVIERPVEPTDLVPTLGALLGFSPRQAQGKPLTEIV